MTAEPDEIGRVQPVVDRGPTVLRIALGGQLRKLRESKGITREAAGDAIRGSHAKISRLELGRTGFKERDIRDLLTLYGVLDTAERESFFELARQASEPGWWHRYSDLLPSWFSTYLGLEQAASQIRTYEAQLVPGLLQTPEYTRAMVTLGFDDADTERRVQVRQRRQDVLHRPEPPVVWAVIDEAVQVLPYSAGGPAAAGSSFSILRFAEPELPDIVYLEQLTSALYLERRQDLALYLSVMDQLSVQAERPDRSREILLEYADRA